MHVQAPCQMHVWASACGCMRCCLDGELIFSMSPSMQVIVRGRRAARELLD